MDLTLQQIIQQGGPVGFALLFAWLWLRADKKNDILIELQLDTANQRRDDAVAFAKEVAQIANETSKSLDKITEKIENTHDR